MATGVTHRRAVCVNSYPYPSTGGESIAHEHNGAAVRIERHRSNFMLSWATRLPAREVFERGLALIESVPSDTWTVDIAPAGLADPEAVAEMLAKGDRRQLLAFLGSLGGNIQYLDVTHGFASLAWQPDNPDSPGYAEVVYASDTYVGDPVAEFFAETAAPPLKPDRLYIGESAARVLRDFVLQD